MATPEADEWSVTLRRARARLLSGDDRSGRPSALRREILESWRRSYDVGAGMDQIKAPYDDNLNLATKLVEAGAPVVRRVHEDIMGSPITVVLADSRGKVLLRRSGESQLESSLDRVMLAPGFSYAEQYVGTNGIGTALEGRAASAVHGREHFNEELQAFACVGVPLRDPHTHRVVGVLDITTWADLASPALTALVRQAGMVIEEGLLELSGRGARALMEEYLHASRDRAAPVLAVSAEALLAAPAATALLGDMRRDDLWPLAQEALVNRKRSVVPLLLPDGSQRSLRMRSVTDGGRLVGALIEVEVATSSAPAGAAPNRRAATVAGLAGLSPATMGAALLVAQHAAEHRTACVVGETAVGKQMIVRAVASQQFPGRNLIVVDASETPLDGLGLVASIARDLSRGSPVLVRRAELVSADVLTELLSAVAAMKRPISGWLALSLRGPSPHGQDTTAEVRSAGVPCVAVPPLRARMQDLEQIVPAMVRRHAGRRRLTVTRGLLSRLVRETWPGNLTEVDDLIKQMVAHARGDTLDESDVPPARTEGLRRELTPIEWMTREAIISALDAHRGNKTEAARSLGMSRASIYRKINALGVPDVQE